jgi:hypothetical protein
MANSKPITLVIDLDKCAALGADTNDILRVILTMYPHASAAMRQELEAVGRAIMNPRMVEALKAIARSAPDFHLVAYTQKSNAIRVLRSQGVRPPEIHSGTMHFAADALESGPDYLCNQCPTTDEQLRSYNELLRIGILTQAMAAVLGRDTAPAVYVTENKKDLRPLAAHLGVCPSTLFLFDDSAQKHIDSLVPEIRASGKSDEDIEREIQQLHMIAVEEYDFTSNDPVHAEELRRVLEAHFPVKGLKDANPTLYSEILHDPKWPVHNRCIDADENWVVHYPGVRAPVAEWNIVPVLEALSMGV